MFGADRRPGLLPYLMATAFLSTFAGTTAAQQARPIQVSLLTPVQIFPEEDSIFGLRLNLLYGRNAAVTGLDSGLVNHTRVSGGAQVGIVGITDARFVGWQDNIVSVSRESLAGAQTGLVAIASQLQGLQGGAVTIGQSVEGFQYGLVNYAKAVRGFQLGLINYASTLKGLQVGLGNIIAEGGWLPFFPIFNFGL